MSKLTLSCIVIFGFSSSAFAQFFVQHDAVLILQTPESTLSVQEAHLQINAPLQGQGTLILNSSGLQTLESTQRILALPNLSFEHANLVQLNTAFRVEQQITLHSGELLLEHSLYLRDQTALVVLNNSRIQSKEFLVYDHQITTNNQPLLVWSHNPISKYTSQTHKELSFLEIPNTQQTNFGRVTSTYKSLHFQSKTPPPEAA